MYKLKQELPKEFKIKVNPEQSEALQKHLFSIGKQWGSGDKYVKKTDDIFLYSYTYIFAANEKVYEFQKSQLPRIKFKDYFENVEEFPEKWCILVTEDNYQELNTWMHRNWKNYENYTDIWKVCQKSIGHYFSNCNSSYGGHSYLYATEFTQHVITTEQFRAKYGDLKPKQSSLNVDTNFVDSFIMSTQYQSVKQLKEENDKLKHKILMLTEKLETIKKVIE